MESSNLLWLSPVGSRLGGSLGKVAGKSGNSPPEASASHRGTPCALTETPRVLGSQCAKGMGVMCWQLAGMAQGAIHGYFRVGGGTL
jgi:hypothetical protein